MVMNYFSFFHNIMMVPCWLVLVGSSVVGRMGARVEDSYIVHAPFLFVLVQVHLSEITHFDRRLYPAINQENF